MTNTTIWINPNGKDKGNKATNNLEALLYLQGYQGGTIHQAAQHYNCKVSSILKLDWSYTQNILTMMNSGKIANEDTLNLTRKALSKQGISMQDIALVLLGTKLQSLDTE